MTDLMTQIARWLFGAESPCPGQGSDYAIEHTATWPVWVTLLFLLASAVAVIALYARERGGARIWVKTLLAGLRLAAIGVAAFMLYGWLLRPYCTDLPDAVVIIDDSASMLEKDHFADSALRTRLAERLKSSGLDEPTRLNLSKTLLLENDAALLEQLEEKYNLKFYRLAASAAAIAGEEGKLVEQIRALEIDPGGKESSRSMLGKGLRSVLEAQRGRPTAAVIMLTDGITTEGKTIGETAEYARRKAVPLFLVGIGSTKPARDLRLTDLLVEDVVFAGDAVSFDFKITGAGYGGEQAEVRLMQKGVSQPLAKQNVRIAEDGRPQSVRLTHRPEDEGELEYTVEIVPLADEATVENNRESRTVTVRNATIRVLLVQAYPNHEFDYLKALLGRQRHGDSASEKKAFALTTILQEADPEYAELDETAQRVFPVRREELFAYDAVIMGDVNPAFLSQSARENLAAYVKERGGGLVFVAGPHYTPLAWRATEIAELFPMDLDTVALPNPDDPLTAAFRISPTAVGLTSPQMQLGRTTNETIDIWSNLGQLYWLMEAPDLKPGVRVLAEHPTRSGPDGKPLPAIVMHYVGAGKVVFHFTDETWRWRRRVGDLYYARYWVQTIRYLSRSALLDKDRHAELTTDREEYRRGDPVRLRVRFFDERLAPAEDDGVVVMIEQQGGKRRRVTLRRDAARRGVFEGLATDLPEAQYRAWVATPTLEGKPPSVRFNVIAPLGERARLEMDAADLKFAAEETRGKFYTLETADRLLRDLPRGRQVRIESLPPQPIWNSWKLAALLVVLLTGEWLLRKKAGML
jgi:hypothetical protein